MDDYPTQHVPPRSASVRLIESVVFGAICSLIAGGIFGGLAGVCMTVEPLAFVVGGSIGAGCGLLCAPAMAFAMYQEARGRALWVLFGVTLVVSMLFGASLGPASVVIAVPTWLFGLLHIGRKARTERRFIEDLRNNLCTRCKYDLSGNTSGRCPECGQLS